MHRIYDNHTMGVDVVAVYWRKSRNSASVMRCFAEPLRHGCAEVRQCAAERIAAACLKGCAFWGKRNARENYFHWVYIQIIKITV